MIPVKQTIFGEGKGNCLSACFASILELPISEVPNVNGLAAFEWYYAINEWLLKRGYVYLVVPGFVDKRHENIMLKGWYIVGGKSPRGDFGHAVVGHKGKLYFDPHPDNAMLKTIEEYGFLIPLNPKK